jgi:hypothetical protein
MVLANRAACHAQAEELQPKPFGETSNVGDESQRHRARRHWAGHSLDTAIVWMPLLKKSLKSLGI